MDEKGLERYDVLDCVRIATETKERGLVLTKAAQPSESILILPSKYLLNVSTLDGIIARELLPSGKNPSHPHHWQDGQDEDDAESLYLPLTSVQALTFTLAQWKAAQRRGLPTESSLNLFLSSFPESYPTFPLAWKARSQTIGQAQEKNAHIGKALLQALPSYVAHLCDQVQKRFEKDCRAIRLVERKAAHLLGDDHITLNLIDLIWAWCSVNSRCVYIPLGLKRHEDNFTLAPLLDMANHTFDTSVECKVKWTSTGGLQLSAPSKSKNANGLEAGQEIFITYGPHSNGTLLSEYGFILPSSADRADPNAAWTGNPYAEINVDHIIEARLAKQGDWGLQKVELLEQHGYHGDYTIHPFPSPAHPSHRLVIALRLVVLHRTSSSRQFGKAKKQKMADDDDEAMQIKAWEEMVLGQRDVVSADNEMAVQELLLCICDESITTSKENLRHTAF